jgi:hypothetical protein
MIGLREKLSLNHLEVVEKDHIILDSWVLRMRIGSCIN